MIDGDDLRSLRRQLAELEVDQLRGIDLVEPVAGGDIAGLVELHRHAIATGDDAAAFAGSIPHRVVDDRRAHVVGKSKYLCRRRRGCARLQALAPPAIAGNDADFVAGREARVDAVAVADVLAVDKDIHKPAKLPRIVPQSLANPGMGGLQRVEDLRRRSIPPRRPWPLRP